jgi:cytidylate kinase
MAVITVSRQMGSLGCEVANAAAQRLGYKVVWREVINAAARRSGAHEVGLATIDELGLLGIKPSPQARRAYQSALAQVINELAQAGDVVIVGRAGQAILHGRPDVLHVRVIAPFELRAERVAEKHHVNMDAARAQVEASDLSRRRFLSRSYHVRWDDSALYDLVINTERIAPDDAAVLICQALRQFQRQVEPERPREPCGE